MIVTVFVTARKTYVALMHKSLDCFEVYDTRRFKSVENILRNYLSLHHMHDFEVVVAVNAKVEDGLAVIDTKLLDERKLGRLVNSAVAAGYMFKNHSLVLTEDSSVSCAMVKGGRVGFVDAGSLDLERLKLKYKCRDAVVVEDPRTVLRGAVRWLKKEKARRP
jgi:hypothetical protein